MIYTKEYSKLINGMTIRERSDGRLEGRITVNGKTKSFYGKAKTEVRSKAKEYLTKVDSGYIDSNVKFGKYMEHWLNVHSAKVEESSAYNYAFEYNTYIKREKICNKKIADISTEELQRMINGYAHPANASNPLSYGTVKNLKILLNTCFSAAVKNKVIATNPMSDVKMPKKTFFLKQDNPREILTEDEMKRFKRLCLTKNNSKRTEKQEYKYKYGFHFLLLLNLGLRVGELLSLQWKDINFEEQYVYINTTAHIKLANRKKGADIRYKIKNSTKTPSGVRYLKLNNEVLWYFKEIKRIQESNNENSDFVCTASYDSLRMSLAYLINKAGIDKKITPHCLRHTFGSALIQKGVNVEIVSKLMGHANITTTYNIYIHTIEEQRIKTMQDIVIC